MLHSDHAYGATAPVTYRSLDYFVALVMAPVKAIANKLGSKND